MELIAALNQLTDVEFNELLTKAFLLPDGGPFKIENISILDGRKEISVLFQESGKREVIEL